MHENSFDIIDGKKIVAVKNGKKLAFSNEELLRLWMFDNHVSRLVSFTGPLYRDMSFSVSIPSKKSKRGKNIPSELRLSALINELRPFMLKKDPIFFLDIRKIVSKQFNENEGFNNCMRNYKKMQVVHKIDKVFITTYAQLLKIFIYGKYIHNDKNPEYSTLVERIEYGPYYEGIRVELGICIGDVCNILRVFDKDFIKPILSVFEGTIKDLNWQSLNISEE